MDTIIKGSAREFEFGHRARGVANDEEFAGSLPAAMVHANELAQICREVLDAPNDVPDAKAAYAGMIHCIRAAVLVNGISLSFAMRLEEILPILEAHQVQGAAVHSVVRRKGVHLLYELVLQIGRVLMSNRTIDSTAAEIVGTHLVRRFISTKSLSPKTISLVRASVLQPSSMRALNWRKDQRDRALRRASRDLNNAIESNPKGAHRFGFAVRVIGASLPVDAISVANRAFRRRTNNLIDFATQKQIAGANGYGTLSLNSLRTLGKTIKAQSEVGDKLGTLIALEIISHLPAKSVSLVPVVFEGCQVPLPKLLVWVDLDLGTYNYRLFNLEEKGARPVHSANGLYEQTTQVVSINLPDFLMSSLRDKLQTDASKIICLGDLLGQTTTHHPRASIDQRSGYRHTARRLQESLPAHLLQMGLARWPIALMTNSHFLVSRGRRSYGICRQSQIDTVAANAYKLLGWPVQTVSHNPERLIGSYVTPKASSIQAVLSFLAIRADESCELHLMSTDDFVSALNAHAAWVSALLCFAFALRKWNVYRMNAAELCDGDSLHVDDKHVHETGLAPLPIPNFVKDSFSYWQRFCGEVVEGLRGTGTQKNIDLAETISMAVTDKGSSTPVFTVDAAGELQGVGHETWYHTLPPTLRIVENFGRHYWPLRLMDANVEQLTIDILMRHQISAARAGVSTDAISQNSRTARLKKAMNKAIVGLNLKSPKWTMRNAR